jgi:cation diffusion facilitator family transporter
MQRERLRVITWVLIVGVAITILKFVAFFITHSNAIYTDALENIINVLAAAVAFYSIYLSARPKDLNHPYGHGKIEFFAVGFEGALICFAGINILYRAIYGIIFPSVLDNLVQGIWLTSIAGAANLLMGWIVVQKGKKLKSVTLEADGKHLLSDAYSSLGLIIGLILIQLTGIQMLDNIIALILAGVILWSGSRLIRKSVAGLMDEVDEDLLNKIVEILQANRKPQWVDVHNLRVQKYGPDIHIDCHVTLPFYFDLQQMHDELKAIENLLEINTQTNVELFIHVDPCLPECCSYCTMGNCAERSAALKAPIVWTNNNVMLNAKHFNQHV